MRIDVPADHFDPVTIMRSGQCFRWHLCEDGYVGVIAFGKFLRLKKENDLVILDTSKEDFDDIWKHYLDLDLDYSRIGKMITEHNDPHLKESYELGKGIRILNQDPWEVIVSFMISQNNNIPRISSSIEKICRKAAITIKGGEAFSFPKASDLDEEFFNDPSLGLGYRAEYLTDMCAFVKENPEWIDGLKKLSHDELYKELIKRKGIGPKVCECIALFGFHKTDAFPIDTHVKSLIEKYYKEGFDAGLYSPYGGIIQQYLFYYEIFKK